MWSGLYRLVAHSQKCSHWPAAACLTSLHSVTAVTDSNPTGWALTRQYSSKGRKKVRKGPMPEGVDSELLPQVCIVGRPNVGKSALYNRLVRRKEALVFDTPGSHVTRDYREGLGQLGDLIFRAIDTSGLEPYLPNDTLQGRATQLTAKMMARSDLVLLMLDARQGVSPADVEIATWMRSNLNKSNIIVTANKCELRSNTGEAEHAEALADAAALGLGEPVAISAAHGEGMADLFVAMQERIDGVSATAEGKISEAQLADMDSDDDDLKSYPLKLAVVGLPNVGKSTLCNQLVGEERSLTGPEPGLTRDAVKTRFEWQGWKLELVDTAGWMRQTRLDRYDDVGGAVAKMAAHERIRSIRLAHAVALVIDADAAFQGVQGISRRELAMASEVVDEGRGLVLVLNKVDLIPVARRAQFIASVQDMVRTNLPQVPGLPCLPMSAVQGEGVASLLPEVEKVYEEWNLRIGTGQLNRWFEKVKARLVGTGGSTGISKVKYITQVKRRPPSFSAFVSGTKPLPEASARFITTALREDYAMYKVPIRISFRPNSTSRPPR